jgi:hypothetical protein
MSSTRKVLYIAIAVVLGTVFAVMFFEGGLRLFGKPSRYFNAGQKADSQSLTVKHSPDAGLYEATTGGRRLRANTRGTVRDHFLSHIDVEIRTNEFGFRGGPVDWERHPRILMLGDSITLGDYLPEEKTFSALIEAKLKKGQVLNSGVGSIGIDNELAILRENAERVKPDVVVLNLYLNDVLPSPVVELIYPPRILSSLWTVQYLYQGLSLARYALTKDRNDTIPHALWEGWRLEVQNTYPAAKGDYRTSREAFYQKIQENFRDWGSAWSPPVTGYILSRVDQMASDCKKLGAKFYVVIHPVSYQVETEYSLNDPQKALMNGLVEKGIPTLDLLPTFRAEYKKRGNPQLFYDQCHHTPEGSEIAADAIFNFLGL